jgi:hypothetical protein
MKKIKTIGAFEESLLDGKGDKRDHKKDGTGNEVEKPPDFVKQENIWLKEKRVFAGRLKGWEKLSVEGYYCGWLDYFDTVIQKDENRLIYFDWEYSKEDGKSGSGTTTLTIYTDPSAKGVAEPTSIQTSLPKPPPPSG